MTPHSNTILSHINVGLAAAPLELCILSPIVNVVISDMFFHPDKQGGTIQTTCEECALGKRGLTPDQGTRAERNSWKGETMQGELDYREDVDSRLRD